MNGGSRNMRAGRSFFFLLVLSLPCLARDRGERVLAATLLWSEAFSVGQVHGGSGLRVTSPWARKWKAVTSRSIKAFRVRPGMGLKRSPWLWLAGGDLARAVDVDSLGTDRLFGPPWVFEVKDVLEEKQRVWIAWAGGVAFTDDFGKTWKDASSGLASTFVSVLKRIPNRGNDLVAGTEKGLSVWSGKKNKFDRVILKDVAVRCVVAAGDDIFVGTFRKGVYKVDARLRGRPEPFGLDGCTVEALACLDGILYAATDRRGICRRAIRGEGRAGERVLGPWESLKKWDCHTSGVVLLKDNEGETNIFVSTHGRGVWVSRDGGKTFQPFGLEGGHVSSLALVPPRKRDGSAKPGLPSLESFEERRKAVKEWFLWKARNEDYRNFYVLKWLLEDEKTREEGLSWLAGALRNPRGDMFFQYAAVGAYLKVKHMLPAWLAGFFRYTLLSYDGYRGDTENHLCMWHSALYLTACAFPDGKPSVWHTGLSSGENKRFARSYLRKWMADVFKYGQMEYDSPHYMAYFMGPLLLLHDFAPDRDIKEGAKAMLDLILADYAEEHFKGIYGGGHSREPKYAPYRMDWDAAGGFAYLYFGSKGKGGPRLHPVAAFAAQSNYECPETISEIATDRSGRWTVFERKRVRNMWRYHEKRNPPVFKLDYVTPCFIVGTTQGGLLQPIQQHTWDASWRDGDGRARTVFTLHPYMSPFELASFFPEGPLRMPGIIMRTKPVYFDEDKWVSSSPWERTFQDKSTVIAFYNIPKCEKADHADAYLPVPLGKMERYYGWYLFESGPVFCGVFPTGKCMVSGAPDNGTRLRVRESPCAFVVEVQEKDSWPSFRSFRERVTGNRPVLDKKEKSICYKNLQGDEMVFTWPDERILNGKRWRYPEDLLFRSPWMYSRLGSGVVRIRYGKKELELDMNSILKKGGK